MKRRLVRLAAAGSLLLVPGLSGCGLHSGTEIPADVGPGTLGKGLPLKGVTLTIASKNFTENVILAEMMGLVWTAAGADVIDRTNISGSIGARQAIVTGTGDGMYEYTGTAWITYLGNTKPIPDPQQQWQAVHDADLRNGITWLPQSQLNDTYALGGNAANIAKYHLKTLSDVAALSRSNPSAVTLCVDNEFGVRDDGLTGMEKAYGMAIPKSNIRTMDAGIVYTTLSAGKSCLLGDVYSTDGRIPALKLQVLADDRHFFPNYDAAPEMYSKAVQKYPAIPALLNPVSAKLDNTVAQTLNGKVDVEGQDPRAVARQWLIDQGFVVPKKK